MARRRLEVGEVATVRTTKLAERRYRAYGYTRLRDGSRVQVQAEASSATKATERVKAAAARRAHTSGSGITGATPLHVVANEYIDGKFKAGKIRESTAVALRGDIRRARGRDGIADLPLVDCSPHVVQSFLSELSERKPNEAKRLRGTLKGTFAYAVKKGASLEHAAPVGDVELTAPARKLPRAFTVDEENLLRARVAYWQAGDKRRWQHMLDAVEVLLGTGLRLGELLALRWQDIDLDAATPAVTVAGTVIGDNQRQDMPKTKASRRTLVPTAAAVEALRRVKGERHPLPSDIVFASRAGGVMSRNNFGRRWREAVGVELEWAVPHNCRKTCATKVYRVHGVEVAAAIMGHEGAATVQRHYIEAQANIAPDVRDALEAPGPGAVIAKLSPTVDAGEVLSVPGPVEAEIQSTG